MNLMDRRYTLDEPLGRGGVGVVYRAYDHLEGRHVALKRMEVDPIIQEIHPLAASPRYQHMLLAHEFRTLASLRHPNIISVLDYGFTSGRQPFFVMELLENSQTILEAAQGLDTTGKVDLLIQMLQALIYLHHHKILHRDLKPNNVLVNQAGQVKVLDFGLAVKQGDHQEQAGTIHYMAPEVLKGESAVEASDLYAIGVIAYEMFTSERPFKGTLQRELTRTNCVFSARYDSFYSPDGSRSHIQRNLRGCRLPAGKAARKSIFRCTHPYPFIVPITNQALPPTKVLPRKFLASGGICWPGT